MAVLSRHRFLEGLLSIGCLGVLVAAVAAMDESVRVKLDGVLSGGPANELAVASGGLQRVVYMAMESIGGDSTMHAPLVLFVLAAVALLLLMLRP